MRGGEGGGRVSRPMILIPLILIKLSLVTARAIALIGITVYIEDVASDLIGPGEGSVCLDFNHGARQRGKVGHQSPLLLKTRGTEPMCEDYHYLLHEGFVL